VTVEYTDRGGQADASFDRLIVSIGRIATRKASTPRQSGLKLSAGFVAVDGALPARVSPACGRSATCVRGPMLAAQGGRRGPWRWPSASRARSRTSISSTIPWCDLHDARDRLGGQDRATAQGRRRRLRAGTFPFMANARARALGDTSGLVKFVADAKTDAILGVAHHRSVRFRADRRGGGRHGIPGEQRGHRHDLPRPIPPCSEAMKDAALAVDKRALNI